MSCIVFCDGICSGIAWADALAAAANMKLAETGAATALTFSIRLGLDVRSLRAFL
ncbi:hypothetical protein AB0N62_45125 [Streptomyces sp. NPDC093982]|uniref:hypothetical protein n=1 Tax=Streptomyces sp. NPDC093982 TaxID=3155077 RepID=UPI00343B59A5